VVLHTVLYPVDISEIDVRIVLMKFSVLGIFM